MAYLTGTGAPTSCHCRNSSSPRNHHVHLFKMKSLCPHHQTAIGCQRALRSGSGVPPRACSLQRGVGGVASTVRLPQPQQQQQQQHHQTEHQPNQQQQQQQTNTWCAAVVQRAFVAVAAWVLASSAGSGAACAATAEANFTNKCAGCHLNGGNVLAAGATLFSEDLVRNSLADSEPMFALLYSGKGRMPGFGADCAPRGACTFGPRLTDEELHDLVQYVQGRAAAGWKAAAAVE